MAETEQFEIIDNNPDFLPSGDKVEKLRTLIYVLEKLLADISANRRKAEEMKDEESQALVYLEKQPELIGAMVDSQERIKEILADPAFQKLAKQLTDYIALKVQGNEKTIN